MFAQIVDRLLAQDKRILAWQYTMIDFDFAAVRYGVDTDTSVYRSDTQGRWCEPWIAAERRYDIACVFLQRCQNWRQCIDSIYSFFRCRAVCGDAVCLTMPTDAAFVRDHDVELRWFRDKNGVWRARQDS